jgi:hypothetical protein
MPYKNKEDRQKQQEAYRNKNHEKMWDYLTTKSCHDCGIKDPRVLEFDHLPEYEKRFDIARAIAGSTRSWKLILEEIEKCDVICANCHRIRTMIRGNYKRHQSFSKQN